MSDAGRELLGRRVLVLEDDYYLATDLQASLEAAGATVMGPFAYETDASRALAECRPDCAFVDVHLGNGPSFELPRALSKQAVPFAFVTGYDQSAIPDEFGNVLRFEKPINVERVVQSMARLLQER